MILWCLTVRWCVPRRRRQVRAAGTTNRLVDKDPRSQPSVSSRQSRKDRGLHSGTAVGSATPTSRLPPHRRPRIASPAPALQPLERKQEMPRVAFPSACSASCTSFEKSSLLRPSSSAPDTRHGLFERRPRQLEAELLDSPRRCGGGFSPLSTDIVKRDRSCFCRVSNNSMTPVLCAVENGQFL